MLPGLTRAKAQIQPFQSFLNQARASAPANARANTAAKPLARVAEEGSSEIRHEKRNEKSSRSRQSSPTQVLPEESKTGSKRNLESEQDVSKGKRSGPETLAPATLALVLMQHMLDQTVQPFSFSMEDGTGIEESPGQGGTILTEPESQPNATQSEASQSEAANAQQSLPALAWKTLAAEPEPSGQSQAKPDQPPREAVPVPPSPPASTQALSLAVPTPTPTVSMPFMGNPETDAPVSGKAGLPVIPGREVEIDTVTPTAPLAFSMQLQAAASTPARRQERPEGEKSAWEKTALQRPGTDPVPDPGTDSGQHTGAATDRDPSAPTISLSSKTPPPAREKSEHPSDAATGLSGQGLISKSGPETPDNFGESGHPGDHSDQHSPHHAQVMPQSTMAALETPSIGSMSVPTPVSHPAPATPPAPANRSSLAPAIEALIEEAPSITPAAVSNIRIRLQPDSASSRTVDVNLMGRGNEVRVAVHSQDLSWNHKLRNQIGDLVSSLERGGYQALTTLAPRGASGDGLSDEGNPSQQARDWSGDEPQTHHGRQHPSGQDRNQHPEQEFWKQNGFRRKPDGRGPHFRHILTQGQI